MTDPTRLSDGPEPRSDLRPTDVDADYRPSIDPLITATPRLSDEERPLTETQDGPNTHKMDAPSDVTNWTTIKTTRPVVTDDRRGMTVRDEWWHVPTFVVAALRSQPIQEPRPDLRERFDDIIRRLDEPKLGNPKYGQDRRRIEGELRAVARQALDALCSAQADGGEAPTRDLRDEAMTFVPAWVRDALDFWYLHPGIEAADDLRAAIAEWYRVSAEPDHD
jgi:hypothetical protein